MKLSDLINTPIQGIVKIKGFPTQVNTNNYLEFDCMATVTLNILQPSLLNADIHHIVSETEGACTYTAVYLKGWASPTIER